MRRRLAILLTLMLSGWSRSALADVPTYDVQILTKTASVSAVVSASTIWTPAADHSIALLGCSIAMQGANTVKVQSSGTDVIPSQYFESAGGRMIGGGNFPIWVGSADATLTWTTTTAAATTIMCFGYEFLQ